MQKGRMIIMKIVVNRGSGYFHLPEETILLLVEKVGLLAK
jgi:hypothetical protein